MLRAHSLAGGRRTRGPRAPVPFHSLLAPVRVILAAVLLGASWPGHAAARITAVEPDPFAGTTCTFETFMAKGYLPDPCFEVKSATLEGPLPLACPSCPTTYVIEITVRAPNPASEIACPLVITPYERSFAVGRLPEGRYRLVGIERVVPYSPDSAGVVIDSSQVETNFQIYAAGCDPAETCYLLGFAPPAPDERLDTRVCHATARPGETGCFDVTMAAADSVGGIQLDIDLLDSVPVGTFTPVSVIPMGRASGFQVAWRADGSRVRLLLFSPDGTVIEPGEGPVARVCYSVGASASPGRYWLAVSNAIVSDPKGSAIPACPTLVPVYGIFCVTTELCDLNGDGVSDILDVIRLVQCALAVDQGSEACPDTVAARADCNADGAVDIRDVVCCVRRILSPPPPPKPPVDVLGAAGPVWSGAEEEARADGMESAALASGTARIGFAEPARWLNPAEGRAVLELETGGDFAGVQFTLRRSGAATFRVRGFRAIEGPATDRLEWVPGDDGVARAMLYSTAPGARPAGRSRIEILLERLVEAGGAASLDLDGVRSGDAAGAEIPTEISGGSAAVPEVGAVSAPAVLGARPNPFRGSTEIAYALPAPARVTLRVFGVDGRSVRTLVHGVQPAGVHRAAWDGRDDSRRAVGAGIYFARFEAGPVVRVERLLLLR